MIRINGKTENYAVDLSNPLEINWKELEVGQVSYELTLLTQEKEIFFREKKETLRSFSIIDLKDMDSFEERKKVIVSLKIIDEDENEKLEKTVFYTENKHLSWSKWITRKDNPIEKETVYYKDKPNIILSRTFNYSKSEEKDLFLDISGLGYYTLYINGEKVNPYYLNTDVTNYDKRVYYDTYKLNDYILEGENVITTELANGWYNSAPLLLLNKYNLRNQLSTGKPCLLAQVTEVTKEGQKVILKSDNRWESRAGNYLFDNLYIGERVNYSDVKAEHFERIIERKTVAIPGPSGELKPSFIPKIVRKKKCLPTTIKKIENGYLVAFDQVISGHFSCSITTQKETTLHLKYSEVLNADETLDFASSTPGSYGDLRKQTFYPVIQEDQVTVSEGTQTFENQYTYHSFQYVLIESVDSFDIENIHAYTVHTDMEQSSYFTSSNDWFNKLYQVSIDTKLNNIHSYYEDCPRERLGYGGDIVALIHSQIHSFQSKQLLEKVLTDFELEQSVDGGITQTAPFMGIQTHGTSNRAGSLGWQYVVPVLLKKLIQHYGAAKDYQDKLVLLQNHIEYLLAFDYEYIKHCCLGDWGSIDTSLVNGKETPPDRLFCSAVFYLLLLQDYRNLFYQISDESKGSILLKQLNMKIDEVRQLITEEFYHTAGYFGEGSQSSYVFALKAELGRDQSVIYNHFIQKLESDKGILRMGIFGMAWIYECLKTEDQIILSNWLSRRSFPSFYNMLENGSNILTEYFTDDSDKYLHVSRNHAMFSSYGAWFISNILGIKVDDQTETSDRVTLEPYFVEELSFAKGHLDTIHGKVKVRWEKENDKIHYHVQVPRSLRVEMDESKLVKTQHKDFYTEYVLVYK